MTVHLLPSVHGINETLSDLIDGDPDWKARSGITIGRGLIRDRDGKVLDTLIASERLGRDFAYLAVCQSDEGSGDWRSCGHMVNDAAGQRLTAALRAITGGEGRFP